MADFACFALICFSLAFFGFGEDRNASKNDSTAWSFNIVYEDEDRNIGKEISRRNREGGTRVSYGPEDPHLTPYFQEPENPANITAQLGSSANLDCRINRLRDKTVSWVRRQGEKIKLLTFGLSTYSNDNRISLNFEHPNNWKLQIKYTQRRDGGIYECQISTHPPKIFLNYLNIVAPVVEILDERGAVVEEKFYKMGSTIELRCTISQMPQAQTFILWRHEDKMLNYDTSRGGISVKTDMSSSVIVSTLFIAKASPRDSGNYTCSLGDVASGSVIVRILNGRNKLPHKNWHKGKKSLGADIPAAMELGCGNNELCCFYFVFLPILFSRFFDRFYVE